VKRCDKCGTRIVFGGIERDCKLFCGEGCLNAVYPRPPVAFCPDCVRETTDSRPGDLGSLNGWGFGLKRDRAIPPCPTCGSTGGRVWFMVFFIPIIPIGRYRVLYKWKGFPESTFLARGFVPSGESRDSGEVLAKLIPVNPSVGRWVAFLALLSLGLLILGAIGRALIIQKPTPEEVVAVGACLLLLGASGTFWCVRDRRRYVRWRDSEASKNSQDPRPDSSPPSPAESDAW
jgi:hypothetical protein